MSTVDSWPSHVEVSKSTKCQRLTVQHNPPKSIITYNTALNSEFAKNNMGGKVVTNENLNTLNEAMSQLVQMHGAQILEDMGCEHVSTKMKLTDFFDPRAYDLDSGMYRLVARGASMRSANLVMGANGKPGFVPAVTTVKKGKLGWDTVEYMS